MTRGYVFAGKLDEIQNLLTNILESLTGGVIVTDPAGRIRLINLAARRILGLSETDEIPPCIFDLVDEKSDVGKLLSWAIGANSSVQDRDLTYDRDKGTRIPVRVSVAPLKGGSDETTGFIILIKDITELMRLEQQLRTADKIRAMGTLAAGIAHEVRNPLSALDLNLRLLREEIFATSRDDAEVKKYLEILEAEIKRLNGIVENFLKFARPAKVEFKRFDIEALLNYVISLVEYEAAEKKIAIEMEVEGDLPPLTGSEALLEQAFLNIIINAFQAMPHGGTLAIKASKAGLNGREEHDQAIEVRITDNGVGIPPENIDRIFDPYFTTSDEGLGLGLTIAHRIIEDHNGAMSIESRVGKGTTLTVRLPTAGFLVGGQQE